MNVLYASNEAYARHLAVSATSLFDRNRDMERITVYVISMGIGEESRKRLLGLAKEYGRQMHFLELGDIRKQFDHAIDTGGFDASIMARLFMGRLLPCQVERVLYLDCDTVVVRSLKKLWETDLLGHVLGAVMEPTIYEAVKDSIGLKREEAYFNSGVLLVDLKRWRQTEGERRLLQFYREKQGRLFASDQDVLNGTFRREIYSLAPEYNFFPNYRYFHYGDLVKHSPVYGQIGKGAFQEAKRHPAIIHYAGDERPWIAGNLCHYRKPYEHYLEKTPWAGTEKIPGKRLYMLLYHGMDYATFVCPGIRWLISRRFGMKAVEARKA